jgi:hypothetical protein
MLLNALAILSADNYVKQAWTGRLARYNLANNQHVNLKEVL